MATHNRREVVLRTLNRLNGCGLSRGELEIIVVDNASCDGTAEAAQPYVNRLIRLRRNRGSCAKQEAIRFAAAPLVLFLDDDSIPRPGSLQRMIRHFESDSKLAAGGFTVHLSDGRREGSALPEVFVGCGVGLRKAALQQAGGLDRTFFMQAEEYDLCFRLATAGWRVRVFDDLHVDHLKTPAARRSQRTAYYDVRNNLRIIARYLSGPVANIYRDDWLLRYQWLAERYGHQSAFLRGRRAGCRWSALERLTYCRRRLPPESFEWFFQWSALDERMCRLRAMGVRRLVFFDFGKNIFGFLRAAMNAGIDVAAIADDRFAAPGRAYRSIPLLDEEQGLACEVEAIVVSNTGAVHAAAALERLNGLTHRPVHAWYADTFGAKNTGIHLLRSGETADKTLVAVDGTVAADHGRVSRESLPCQKSG